MKNIKKVIFRKIANDHNALRDDEIHGQCFALPCAGEPFVMVAPPRDTDIGFRRVNTSPVTEIISDDWGCHAKRARKITFKTESGSIYSVEEIK